MLYRMERLNAGIALHEHPENLANSLFLRKKKFVLHVKDNVFTLPSAMPKDLAYSRHTFVVDSRL